MSELLRALDGPEPVYIYIYIPNEVATGRGACPLLCIYLFFGRVT